ncbi:sensor histidine kinase [Hymenobacter sediminicola]|uniref:histidine kinase n=1 Tax=Hymenobacter sediminicola TaxID=2761579 RepID=A0A7G7W3B2_9BACT|nr:ATP-binding protein [Hymenobacter sediminicola]QNH60855.1 PAS domain-containing protein [Hymenobacter sediminicola]
MTPTSMPDSSSLSAAELARENQQLRLQLQEAEELISAIRTGSVDALAVQGADGPRIYTLEGADQSYRTLIEQMNEGALLLSQDSTVLYCNACMASLLDRGLEAVMGTDFADFVPADYQAYWQTLLAAGWAGKSKGEMPLSSQQGLLRPFALALNVLTFNETSVLAVIVTDMSAQREISAIQAQVAEQNMLLAHKNEELKTQESARIAVERVAAEASRLLEGIPQIAWTAEPTGHNTYLNRRWFDYTGIQGNQSLDSQIAEYIHPDDLRPAIQRWQLSLDSGAPLEVECRIRDRFGEYRWMLGRALPSRNEQEQIVQWIGTYTDIHEQKLAQERIVQTQSQLRMNNEQLTRANIDLDNFIYTASHDLKAPINNIEGLLNALQPELAASSSGNDQTQLLLNMMQDSVERFKRTIEHLTEVTKLQKENDQPAAVIDLASLIQEVSLDLRPLMRSAGGQLEVNVEACPSISFSEKNLRSIVYNLLSNAFKYHSLDRELHVRILTRQTAQFTVLEVHDNGLGLDTSNHERLFAMFQRFHDHVEGSGIGLYMVKKIIENAGGYIEVQSQVGKGASFFVHFAR